ncbi:transporter, major facilitator family protein [Hallella bergensis DSM 17361]|uniref:Transporter, major facilitator family protein n=1 Tax=Hallella bergensis DSM 17361 TaxID=585502 RepID=D1PVP7_9BACT|nr:MFS transporter [Hallella bergensis]EFA44617.1 transporter, major facilitator family protein [Hallella bergensis DSM 17361]
MVHENKTTGVFPWVLMILMSSVTFVGILSELLPSGVLQQIMGDLNINEVEGGRMVGLYALASAIFGIPLISATMHLNRKNLLLLLLIGFAICNILSGLVHNYYLILALRFLGGISAGVMWPMIAAFGMRLVEPNHQGRAVAIIMAGNTLGISLGMPLMTSIGDHFGWRIEFITLGVLVGLIAVLSLFMLPSTPGEKLTSSTSPFAMLKNKAILLIILLTLLGVCGHYGVYTYITQLVGEIGIEGGVEMALLVFGIGSLISIIIATKYIDKYLRELTVLMFAFLGVAMLIFYFFKGASGISHLGFFLWGLSFGPLVTLFQAAVGNQVEHGKDVAMSVQSCMFNLSIMITTWIAGLLLIRYGAFSLLWYAVAMAVPGMIISIFAKHTLRRIG